MERVLCLQLLYLDMLLLFFYSCTFCMPISLFHDSAIFAVDGCLMFFVLRFVLRFFFISFFPSFSVSFFVLRSSFFVLRSSFFVDSLFHEVWLKNKSKKD